MNRQELRNQEYISTEKFLRDYCGIENQTLIDMLSQLSHRDLKELCDELYKIKLVSVPFSTLTKSELSSGEILLVEDAYHQAAPYKNPSKEEIILDPLTYEPIDRTLDLNDYIDYFDTYLTLEEDMVSDNAGFSITKSKKGRQK